MSVSTQPGQIALTCTLSPPSSAASERTRPSRPGLRGAVTRVVRHGDAGEDRRDDDEVPRLGPRRKVLEGGAAAVVRAVQVRRDEVVEAVRLASPPLAPPSPLQATSAWIGPSSLGGASERLLDLAAIADVAGGDVGRLLEQRSGLPRAGSRSRASSVSDAPSRSSRRAIARPIPVPRSGHDDVSLAAMSSPDDRNLRESRSARDLDPRAPPQHRFLPAPSTGRRRTKPRRAAVRGSGRPAGDRGRRRPARRIPGPAFLEHCAKRNFVRRSMQRSQFAASPIQIDLTGPDRSL